MKKCYWDFRFNCYHPNDYNKCVDGSLHPGKEACEELTKRLRQQKERQTLKTNEMKTK